MTKTTNSIEKQGLPDPGCGPTVPVMFAGFARPHLALLRCPVDGGELTCQGQAKYLRSESVRCRCGFQARIDGGILMLGAKPSHRESERERVLRDDEYASPSPVELTDWDLMEMNPVIEALEPSKEDTLLELGAGSGRYTLPLALRCRGIVAVDFSRAGLQRIAERLPDGADVSLVCADVALLRPARGAFSAVLSTLTSNLPTAELRAEMFGVAARALDSGRFVTLAHHWGAMAVLRGLPRDGHYDGRGIYRYFMTEKELQREAGEYFGLVQTRPVRVLVPGAGRLGLPAAPTSALFERVPLVRRLGDLLLAIASEPAIHRIAEREEPMSRRELRKEPVASAPFS